MSAYGFVDRIRARLIVGADGRGSTIARLARVPGRVRRHNRFFYFAYWRGIQPETTDAWFDCVDAFRQETRMDRLLQQDLFWVITRANDCFY